MDYRSLLKRRMKEKRITRRRLAEAMNMSYGHIQRTFAGNSNFSPQTLKRVADYLGFDMHLVLIPRDGKGRDEAIDEVMAELVAIAEVSKL